MRDPRLRLLAFALLILVLAAASDRRGAAEKQANVGLEPKEQENNADDDDIPPFPELFNSLRMDRNRIHIVSESVSTNYGYETLEEYADLSLGKNTFIQTNKDSHSVTHIDAAASIIYRYTPYSCLGMTVQEVDAAFKSSIWTSKISVALDVESNSAEQAPKQLVEMHVYGVIALWLNAAERTKSFAKASVIYSASKDYYRPAHRWTVKEGSDQLVHFFFIDQSNRVGSEELYSLEMIQFEVLRKGEAKGEVWKTINILALESSIPNEVYDNLLQIPVGYGCHSKYLTDKALVQFPSLAETYSGPLNAATHRIELELTATKFDQADSSKRESDTVSVELLRTPSMQLVRQRNSRQDSKVILNFPFNVQYQIDLRSGNCDISNMDALSGGLSSIMDTSERLTVNFANGLSLKMDLEVMDLLFKNHDDYYFIKRTNPSNDLVHLFFETGTHKLSQDRFARVIRTYSAPAKSSSLNIGDETELQSVTIWYFNQDHTAIVETYHLNIIDVTTHSSSELAKLFDVSEECYLNNEKMLPGRDYSWFQTTFPISTYQSELLASNGAQLRRLFYDMMTFNHMDYFRMPRLEVMFTDTSLILRGLFLDLPPLQLMYEQSTDLALVPNPAQGDQEDLAVDLDHCARLCRTSFCKTMTYCADNHKCLLSVSSPYTQSKEQSRVRALACTTYTLPRKRTDQPGWPEPAHLVFADNLQQVLAKLSHQDYGDLELPEMPEEIADRRAARTDDETYRSMLHDYVLELHKLFADRSMPSMFFVLKIDDQLVILRPTKFELEEDPLEELSPAAGSGDQHSILELDEQSVPAFHQGLAMHRYSVHVAVQSSKRLRQFTGLNYDQCSLACVDSRCSSFSYCSHRQECVISDIYELSSAMKDIIVEDIDCFIAQRDFLTKFNKFSNVLRPNIYKRSQALAHNPSECAHACMIESKFQCLAFDFCPNSSPTTTDDDQSRPTDGTCFYLEDRRLYTGIDNFTQVELPQRKKDNGQARSAGCDHYSRSYLADFLRLEYRRIVDDQLYSMQTSEFEGKSIDQCAQICLNELVDCTAFQFCFDPDAKDKKAMQSCTLIESKPADGAQTRLVVDENEQGEQEVKANKLLVSSGTCHVLTLRKDSSVAHLRDLAFDSVSSKEIDEELRRDKLAGGGLSIGGGIMLYFCTAFVFAALGCGVCMLRHRNDYVRAKFERLELLLSIRRR